MGEDSGWSEKGRSSGKGNRRPRNTDRASTPKPKIDADGPARSPRTDRPVRADRGSAAGSSSDAGSALEAQGRETMARAAAAGQSDGSWLTRVGFSTVVGIVCLLGLAGVIYMIATHEREPRPRTDDLWHSVYGVYDCTITGENKYLAPFQSASDATGIHSHGDGLIHIHPYLDLVSGDNATLRHWFNEMDIEVTAERIVLSSGAELRAGSECADDGGRAEVKILHWDFDFEALDGQEPSETFTEDFGSIRFDTDREVYVIALVGPNSEIGLPPAERFATLNTVGPELEWTPGASS